MNGRFFMPGSMLALLALTLSPVIACAQDWDDLVRQAAERNALPAMWVRAVLRAESAGDPHAVSGAGAMGLMQLMPGTWKEVRRTLNLGADPFDPHDNIAAGAAYLRWLHDRYGDAGFLAAYNAGPGRYDDHLATGRPLPDETISYVEFVTGLMKNRSSDIHLSAAFLSFPVRSWVTAALFVSGQFDAFRTTTSRRDAVPENLFAGHVGERSGLVPLRGSDQVQ
ncbi:MAG: lytic transglycosylase domain-containing protein [Acetobacter sp.]|jgi:soluble lytic murein transglycosylase-like protein|nr:lytic transglycosylase domain-containing protein [Acetobacter sp.]MCH4023220.1 lytic transglycosylase domain-containing protein [Acetobacter sp.]MCH4061359.1 lytic transglycosylase domain-containing protein [Acetobacter sp.]MCH4061391.1 lytic transglycosylase domain-containing protein [Acetobacter sp.]MCH4088296.1 lytic transglycosylase domain-containing protein [Acetobacter sp.]